MRHPICHKKKVISSLQCSRQHFIEGRCHMFQTFMYLLTFRIFIPWLDLTWLGLTCGKPPICAPVCKCACLSLQFRRNVCKRHTVKKEKYSFEGVVSEFNFTNCWSDQDQTKIWTVICKLISFKNWIKQTKPNQTIQYNTKNAKDVSNYVVSILREIFAIEIWHVFFQCKFSFKLFSYRR